MPYHLIYQPEAVVGATASRVSLLQTDDPNDVLLQLQAAPEAVAMELEAQSFDEVLQELADLGFTC